MKLALMCSRKEYPFLLKGVSLAIN